MEVSGTLWIIIQIEVLWPNRSFILTLFFYLFNFNHVMNMIMYKIIWVQRTVIMSNKSHNRKMTNNCVSAQFFSAIHITSRSPWQLVRFNVVRSGWGQVERDLRLAYDIATMSSRIIDPWNCGSIFSSLSVSLMGKITFIMHGSCS